MENMEVQILFIWDSWHLTDGVHCPNFEGTTIWDNPEEAVEHAHEIIERRRITYLNGSNITKEDLLDKVCSKVSHRYILVGNLEGSMIITKKEII